ncbi:MAG: DUF5060 domain-containing protein [Acidobacteriota bacterium]|nr:MAG: DUF5060 domain-containing protein [Acidobacteriota bacterium]
MKARWASLFLLGFWGCQSGGGSALEVEGTLTAWEPVTITVTGPEASESQIPNPFLDFRLTVTFQHEAGGVPVEVPGYFAADGDAAESGADAGNRWRVHFVPDRPGRWDYTVSFRAGDRIALDLEAASGTPLSADGSSGSLSIQPAAEGTAGKLRYTGHRYLQFAGNGRFYLKAGADSPENFLAYADFDSDLTRDRTPGPEREGEAALAPLHRYEPHLDDWNEGDPTWRGGLGKGIIGALNYLASKGVNSVYFLAMNIAGDGDDVWPYSTKAERYRFDCSKLAQWNLVFDHMDQLGIMLHVVLTETENENLFESEEGGTFADSRKLYYRELIARFSHHQAVTWNLGEENGWSDEGWDAGDIQKKANTDEQRKAFADYIRALDPWQNPIVVHTLPGRYEEIYRPLVGYPAIEGPSLQMGDMKEVHAETLKWIEESERSGKTWFVSLDEIGPAHTGVMPDADDPGHDAVRQQALWGNLMAGGAGCEWYFGYRYAHNDLNLEDFRSRDIMWDQTRHAVNFFQQYLPFPEMKGADELLQGEGYVFAQPGAVYALYLISPQDARIELPEAEFSVQWYDPRSGGPLQAGSLELVKGPGLQPVGLPPNSEGMDWVCLLNRVD